MSSWTLNSPELEIRHTPLKGDHFTLNPGIETSIDLLEIHSPDVPSLEDPGVLFKRNLGHEALVGHFLDEHMNGKNRRLDTSESIEILHQLSSDLLIIKEDMTDLVERMEFLLRVHSSLTYLSNQTYPGIPVSQSLSFLVSQTGTLRRWVQSYADRTAIQINLLYNLSSQRDNRTNLRIADYTSKIAVETQKDSTSMITMSTVTMLFLPGTFVSALFSMVFFEAGGDSTGYLTVTRGWWLYPVITVPLTVIVFLVWNIWRTRRSRRQLKELNDGSPTAELYDSIRVEKVPPMRNPSDVTGVRSSMASHWTLPPF
ncbi:hypothetical protein MD484_g6251, partial [Candolleomyces efflorescens]